MGIHWQSMLSRVKARLIRRGQTCQDADDLVQEAWLRFARYERRHTVAEPEAFLMRTAVNLSIDAYRASKSRGEHVLFDEDLHRTDSAPSTESVLLGRERLTRLNHNLAELEVDACRIFLAQRMDGDSYSQIAKRYGVSVSAIEKKIAKAALVVIRGMEGWE